MKNAISANPAAEALELLDLHYETFHDIADLATRTGHPVPTDTRGWSQVLVSVLYGAKGLDRRKGADLADGSDVKAANTWKAIDTPRFNGVIKAGTKAKTAGSISSLDAMPHLFLVLWDESNTRAARCRIWAIRTKVDTLFRKMCEAWYKNAEDGSITSTNFQLHPPRGLDTDVIRNTCGNLIYPKYFHAERKHSAANYELISFRPALLKSGKCKKLT